MKSRSWRCAERLRDMSTTRHPMHIALRAARATDAAAAAATTCFAKRRIATHGSTPSDDASYLQRILNARVYEAAIETPLQKAEGLSAYTSNNVLLKREDTQPIFSFKIRGAYNKIAHLSREQMRAGIVCCSAGNHAQGVAYSAKELGIDAVIVMPTMTPTIKVASVRKIGGARVVLHGDSYDEAAAEAHRLVELEGRTLIHPFDDPLVIAGQGTIGVEVLKQSTGRALHAIFVCCGGGGMLAGIASYVKQVRPGVKIIGVEAADAAGMTASLDAGELVTLDSVGLFADGAAVRKVGAETFRICKSHVDAMVTVSTDEICAALKAGFEDTRCVLEPAGALAIAGVRQWAQTHGARDETYVAITSGANMNFDSLRFVSERADASETLLAVEIPERPGSFRRFISLLGTCNVTEFAYRYDDTDETPAHVLLSIQSRGGADELRETVKRLENDGCPTKSLQANELAKLHVRHLAGGRASVPDELVYRFEFPERPGALIKFLDTLDAGWNVSMFHYRNHGGDVGHVLAGIQVPEQDHARFTDFLSRLQYAHHCETDNSAYATFLR